MENELLKQLAAKGCGIEAALAESYMGSEPLMTRIVRKVLSTPSVHLLEDALAAENLKVVFETLTGLKESYESAALTPLVEKCDEVIYLIQRSSLTTLAPKVKELVTLHAEFASLITS